MNIEDIIIDINRLKNELKKQDLEVNTAIRYLEDAIKWLEIVNTTDNVCSISNNYDDIYKDCIEK